ncbi:MAG: DUF2326 domain-containing protein [Bernardetiaceae bacterium]|nr:DUF2326 domain-containing protein [Bernardetiaceae bacterium]
MKLSKLYCNKDFHNISFLTRKGGLNVVVGDSKGEKQHNLGKSKLAELLDFMLLKEVNQKYFFYKGTSNEKFEGYEFYLEILLNNGQYLTIKRAVDNATKIAFKLQEKASEGFVYYQSFDKTFPFTKAKEYLNTLLDFDFCKEQHENYRRLVSYSLRTQGDYEPKQNTIFQLTKFRKGKDKYWKPLLFALLGFDAQTLREKYDLEEKIKDTNKTIKLQENDFGTKTEDKSSLLEKITDKNLEKENLEKELNNFNFYKEDKETIQNLVGNIEVEIAQLNTTLYNLEQEIERLKKSIRNQYNFDIEKVQKIFEEVDLYFSNQLSKSYEELLDFNRQITQERNQNIKEVLEQKEKEYQDINTKLIDLNKEREQFSDLIQDTTFFKKHATYQRKLVEIEKEITHFQIQLEAIEKMENKKTEIENIKKTELEVVKGQLKNILDNTISNELYMKIRRTFSEIVRKILQEDAYITIKPNSNYNIDFTPEFPNSAKADGNTYYKILCIAFDLAVLINYREKSHFRFVYHDDVISGDDNGVKSRLIEVVRAIAERNDIQYIFSAIKDNIPPFVDISENIILKLHDKDESGRLFKMIF